MHPRRRDATSGGGQSGDVARHPSSVLAPAYSDGAGPVARGRRFLAGTCVVRREVRGPLNGRGRERVKTEHRSPAGQRTDALDGPGPQTRCHGALAEGERAPAGAPPAAPRPDPPGPARAPLPRARLRRAVRCVRRRPRLAGGRPAHPSRAHRRVRRRPAAEAPAQRRRGAAPGAGAVGVAALRAGRRPDAAGRRRRAHPHRVRGDEPLERRRVVRAPRVPQEQRARGLLLGAPCAPARRRHRRLRSQAARGRHRVRRHRPWGRHGPERDGRERRRRPHPPAGGRGGLAHPLRAHDPLRQ